MSVFNKSEELAKVGAESTKNATKYVKDDFFDSLSCDVLDRMEGKKTRVTAAEERTQMILSGQLRCKITTAVMVGVAAGVAAVVVVVVVVVVVGGKEEDSLPNTCTTPSP